MKSHAFSPLKTAALGLLGLSAGLGCLKAGSVIAQAWPNWSGTPLYGEISLWSGFEPDPYTVDIVAGGSSSVSSMGLGSGCTGFITAEQPDFRVHYEAGQYPLSFLVESSADTTLVINGPGAGWYCNDDFDGANPMVMFSAPASGQYDIWVGVYGSSSTHGATLYVTEYDLTR
ncbi:hypothetical protein GFS31_38020 [Leptolyngbya sp. BL0902]|uniref:hypothetical protein n=1 Tax=Leptolyngbya sp. BL0902 TaxID=1115757 RepID=UPI0018E8FDEA|nr:hypothetical protein [Leptolyngbya sp. BL0902]QQE67095.1 hypothetical protein GFS31_38020 [Leptolyngbya sp. BL0902]